MRILWISHDPLRREQAAGGSASGFWKESLLECLRPACGHEFFVAAPVRQVMPPAADACRFRVPPATRHVDLSARTRHDLLRIIDNVQPDLIHVHGTEHPYGMIAAHTTIPVLVSLQGFLTACLFPLLGDIPLPEWRSYRTLKDVVRGSDPLAMHSLWTRKAAVERRILRTVRSFAGRTDFDHDFILRHNPTARYYVAHEALRPAFHGRHWRLEAARRHSIFTTGFGNPLKGFHVLLEAIPFLRDEFPDVRVTVPGTLTARRTHRLVGDAYARLLADRIRRLGIGQHVHFAGRLSGEQMAAGLLQSHLFCLPSFMENSSNALGEAMLLGLPVVASADAGGTTSLIDHERTGVAFRKGDPYALAEAVRHLWRSDDRALALGLRAREFAGQFHDPDRIRCEYLDMYAQVVADARPA